MEKIKMNVLERLMALQLLPEKASLTRLRIVHKARMALSLTEQETKEFGIRTIATISKADYDQKIADCKGDKVREDFVMNRFIPTLKQEDVGKTQTAWNPNGSVSKEIDLGLTAISMLKEQLEELDKKKGLTMQFLSLCDKLEIEGGK